MPYIYQNHVVDPTFFIDAIEQFAFNFDIYVFSSKAKDANYKIVKTYTKETIRGSLQSQGRKVIKDTTGTRTEIRYEFYCRSLYRIAVGDYIDYKGLWLLVDEVHDFDEYGVRWAALKEVDLYANQDLSDYVAYLQGEKLV